MNDIISREERADGSVLRFVGKCFLTEFPEDDYHPPILHLQGDAYERGYARGVLAADEIREFLAYELSPKYALIGGWDPLKRNGPTLEQMKNGREILAKFSKQKLVPAIKNEAPEVWEEMKGCYEGLKEMKVTLTWDDYLIINTEPEVSKGAVKCSNFAAWGKATKNGKLVRGDNLDLVHFGYLNKGTAVTVFKSGNGYSYLQVGSLPIICGSTYLNEAGLNYGENTSPSANVKWPQIPHLMHAREIAENASTIQEAYNILEKRGGTTGWNNLICETKGEDKASVIEQTGTEIALREEDPNFSDVIWSTNFFNSYPGWQSYEGPSLIKGQIEYLSDHLDYLQIQDIDHSPFAWEDVDTLDKWLSKFQCPRYNRYKELLEKYYGKIDLETAIEIQSDPELTTKRSTKKIQISPPTKLLFEEEGPLYYQVLFSIYSAIVVPEDGNMWVAGGAEYAQKGEFWRVNLQEELKLMDKIT